MVERVFEVGRAAEVGGEETGQAESLVKYKTLFTLLLNLFMLYCRYPHLPCLQVGQEQKHTYLPLEVRSVLFFALHQFC